ncbi:karyogamy protein [Aulographum hederae CBS 113979]|uniref:Karyogamy protein n=1 Tax=Aulographum hederae CBS 113979 TaxID=1176131 RepID=A0A6G1GXA0_9PEZI|nr:karyogamy protein [Aulographum hederae CBS 113979]
MKSPDEQGPPPPPKDDPVAPLPPPKDSAGDVSAISAQDDVDSYFNPSGLSRTTSIYTLSRASFTNQLSQLTSIKLPNASSLSTSISSIPTSTAAARTLNDAAEQIRMWMAKASEVLDGLDADDDVQWAADGGREGLDDVDAAITRFESLIEVYVIAIEDLQMREDSNALSAEELTMVVERMEHILKSWHQIKTTLNNVKQQVEIAMEWEELWNNILGEIGQEMDKLGQLIFEMEERRHRSLMLDESGSSFDLEKLETIVEEAPSRNTRAGAPRFSNAAGSNSSSPVPPPATTGSQDESNLLSLFARMQPLRASLDFLPMRLSVFHNRGNDIFPSGCDDLEKRREQLEERWKQLESDAESLRRELGEDRWVIVFRNAGRQAQKMCESVERSLAKLREALDEGVQHTNIPVMSKKVESYEQKKQHYGPAIERVLAIIDRGVKDRLTVNGEILRLQTEMRKRLSDLEAEMKAMDFVLVELNVNRHQQLRDSISTILSNDRSVSSSVVDTPGSSPASSVILMSRKNSDQGGSAPYGSGKPRQSSFGGSANSQAAGKKRLSSLPAPLNSSLPRKPLYSAPSSASGSPGSSRLSVTPTPSRNGLRAASDTASANKPRWTGTWSKHESAIGHNFKPLSATEPSPYRKDNRRVTGSSIPMPSPLGRSSASASTAPRPPSASARYRTESPSTPQSKLAPPRIRTTPAAASTSTMPRSLSSSVLPKPSSNNLPFNPQRRVSGGLEPPIEDASGGAEDSPSLRKMSRPTSALAASGRRTSLLPQPRAVSGTTPTTATGRTSRLGLGGRQSSMAGRVGDENKPRWK